MRKFKYYHGTSSIFIESIKENGLGGLNPNFENRNIDLLKFLFEKAEELIKTNPKYLKLQETTLAMIKQTTLIMFDEKGEKHNFYFRHNRIHVTLSEIKAVGYSALNKFGSEILQRCYDLNFLLKSLNHNIEIPKEIDFYNLNSLSEKNIEPIIIEIEEIDDDDLEKEDGKTAKESLFFLRSVIDNLTELEIYRFFQHCNFQLLKPIPFNKLTLFKLEYKGHPRTNNFEYKLTKY